MKQDNRSQITDYDTAIDHLFEGLKAANWLLMTGRMEDLGVALSDRTKERLIERHGAAAGEIVCNTGHYQFDRYTSMELVAPSAAVVRPSFVERLKGVFSNRKPAAHTDTPPPRWIRLLKAKEQEIERRLEMRERILGRHSRDQRVN